MDQKIITFVRTLRAIGRFIEALFCLYFVKTMLLILSFKSLRHLLNRSSTLSRQPLSQVQEMKSVFTALKRAQKFILWRKSFCLVNALSLHWMLKRRGIPSTIHLGVTKSSPMGLTKNKSLLAAHAWIESHGHFLAGSELRDQYTRIASFN